MSGAVLLSSGLGLGAGLMYLLDPDRGKRRRALARDKVAHLSHVVRLASDKTAEDLGNRSRGLGASMASRVRRHPISDAVLAERIRSHIGPVVQHPGSIDVAAHDGHVTLSGLILADEVDRLLARVAMVPGVAHVESHLDVHAQPGNVPGLQGEARPRQGGRFELLQEHWSPAARLVVGVVGSALAGWGALSRGIVGVMAGIAGTGLLVRSLTDAAPWRLVGIGAGRRVIDIQKTMTIDAPVSDVFAAWAHFQQFPLFMDHVRAVHKHDETRSTWVVNGPLGLPIRWNARITKLVPDEVLAWRTEPGGLVQHAGVVRFTPSDRETMLNIKLSYNPLGGQLGHFIATVCGVDPKHALDADLARFKSLLEEGLTTAHGDRVTWHVLSSTA